MEAPRINKEELKSRLADTDLTIVDVRRQRDKEKIQHAILEDPEKTESWMNNYPKDRTLVLYCS